MGFVDLNRINHIAGLGISGVFPPYHPNRKTKGKSSRRKARAMNRKPVLVTGIFGYGPDSIYPTLEEYGPPTFKL